MASLEYRLARAERVAHPVCVTCGRALRCLHWSDAQVLDHLFAGFQLLSKDPGFFKNILGYDFALLTESEHATLWALLHKCTVPLPVPEPEGGYQ